MTNISPPASGPVRFVRGFGYPAYGGTDVSSVTTAPTTVSFPSAPTSIETSHA